MTQALYQQARLSRDARFDGQFFVAVKTTGIFCRPICPAPAPKEGNVEYFTSSVEAAHHGYRPCIRCRPDSAPDSCAWQGKNTSFERALTLINNGALTTHSISALAERLGISSRYLNSLFQENLGTSAKNYAQHQQLMFAKSLIQQTTISMTEIAFAAGFNSVRRFNDCFKTKLKLTPSQLRKSTSLTKKTAIIRLFLSYRPPYAWSQLQTFLQHRAIASMEWCNEHSYGRSFTWPSSTRNINEDINDGLNDDGDTQSKAVTGQFTATHQPDRNGFSVEISISDLNYLLPVVRNIRRILDVDAPIAIIEQQLATVSGLTPHLCSGLRLPGTWNIFEAGVRAILGQQISVTAAIKLVTTLVHSCERLPNQGESYYFPSPQQVLNSDLSALRIPASRKASLHQLAQFMITIPNASPEQWLSIKGIGPWTVDYAKMRGLSDPNIWLGGDLGIKKALNQHDIRLTPDTITPWQSYLTFQVWNLL